MKKWKKNEFLVVFWKIFLKKVWLSLLLFVEIVQRQNETEWQRWGKKEQEGEMEKKKKNVRKKGKNIN